VLLISLPQICLKLKNFGIGRMFIREKYKRYPGKHLHLVIYRNVNSIHF
jgi:hypothetical protein